jgi:hypothetical protein
MQLVQSNGVSSLLLESVLPVSIATSLPALHATSIVAVIVSAFVDQDV